MSAAESAIDAAIAVLEQQRAQLGDGVVDLAIASIRSAQTGSKELPGDVEPTELRLRHVTILFADVVGSTATGRQLDPEQFHELMDTAMRRFTTMVEAVDGRVLKYMGDGLLAAFGAARSSEDDAANAVTAGLGILDAARRIAVDAAAHLGVEFDVRVGIDTGTIVVGGGVEGEHSVRGNAVNLAARMEQSAPVGHLRISSNTHRLVRGQFEALEDPATVVKGIAEPISTYIVTRRLSQRSLLTRRGPGPASPLLARDAELARLHAAFERCGSQRRQQTLLVIADAGLGKSRLLAEFEAGLRVATRVPPILLARAGTHGMRRSYGLIRDLLAWRYGVNESDDARTSRQKLVAGLGPIFGPDEVAAVHLLGHLVGFDFAESPHLRGIVDDGEQVRVRGRLAFAQFVERTSAATDEQPVVLLIDDVQWADDDSLELLDALRSAWPTLPLLVAAASRPSIASRRTSWASAISTDERIELEPLDAAATASIAAAVLEHTGALPVELVSLLARADGNPYFVEELTRMMVDEGVVRRDDGHVSLDADRLASVAMPPTLAAVLQARLDTLGVAERRALQQASVIGFVFWNRAVAALDARSAESLGELALRGLVAERDTSTITDATEMVFQHHLLQQFTYDTLLRRERALYHGGVARWLDRLAFATGVADPGVIAEHYDLAGEAATAAGRYEQAAAQAAHRGATTTALGFVERALDLVATLPDDLDEARWRLLTLRFELHSTMSAIEAARLDAAELTTLAEAADDDAKRADVAIGVARLATRTNELEVVIDRSRVAHDLALRLGDTRRQARALGHRSIALRRRSQSMEALAANDQAVALITQLDDRPELLKLLANRANIFSESGQLGAGYDTARQGLALARELGDLFGEGDMLLAYGYSALAIGDHDAAITALASAIEVARSLGWHYNEMVSLFNLAAAQHLTGDHRGALRSAQHALDLAAAVDATNVEAAALIPLAHSMLALGDVTSAAAAFARSRQACLEEDSDDSYALEGAAGLALLAMQGGDVAAAAEHVGPILEQVRAGRTLDGTEEPLRLLLICWQVLDAADDPGAPALLDHARRELLARADTISEPRLRSMYLDVEHHRAVLAASRRA